MYIPTTFFGANGGYIVSSGGTQGSFVSGSQPYGYNLFTTPGTASFTILSGSVNNARLVIIGAGGGGGRGNDGVSFDEAAGGGGAGGIVTYTNLPITVGTYNIVVGTGGNPGSQFGLIPTGSNGGTSSLQYTYPYTPFTSSILTAFGGGGGGYAEGSFTGGGTRILGKAGASGGGNAQNVNGNFISPSSNAIGIGLNGITFGNQGNTGGFISASVTGTTTAYSATGGGGAGSGSLGITDAMVDSGIDVSAGGIGLQIPIYPINVNTASYFAGGGGAFGPGGSGADGNPNKLSVGGLGYNTYGGGGNAGGNWSGGGRNTESGRGGLVYIEYPLYQPFTPSEMIYDGLTLWNSFTSVSGGIWKDLSGNFNEGLISGSTLNVTDNMVNFNGINNYITYPVTMSAAPSSSMTLIWYGVYNSSSVSYDLFCKEAYSNGWDTIWNNDRKLIVFRDNGDGDLSSSYDYGEKSLYALTVTTTGLFTGIQDLYKDWFKIGSTNKQFDGFNASVSPLKFGWNADTDASYFSGSLSDILIYNRILTSNEIISINNYLSQNFTRPSLPRKTFLRYNVDGSCNLTNATQVWSYINYANGFYSIDGVQYKLEANTHSTYTIEITNAITSVCPLPTQYRFLRYNVDAYCNLSNPTQVWSYTNYSNGFYTIGGTLYRLETNSHTTYTTEITTATSSSCTPALPPSGCMSSSYSGLQGDLYYTTALTASYTSASTAVNNLYNGISGLQLDGTFAGTYNSTDNAWNGQINLTEFSSTSGLDTGTWFFLAKIPIGSSQREFLGSSGNLRHVGINGSGQFKIQGGVYEATSSLNLSAVANYSTEYKVYVWERTSPSSSQFRIEDDSFVTAYPTQVGGLPYSFLTGMDEICKNTGNIKAVAAYNVDSTVSQLTRMSVANIQQIASNIKSGSNIC